MAFILPYYVKGLVPQEILPTATIAKQFEAKDKFSWDASPYRFNL